MKGRVLVVDDDLSMLEVYRDRIAKLGLDVTCVASGGEATELLRDHERDFDVVLLDQRLEGPASSDSSGVELIESCGRLAPMAKTIVVTGYGDWRSAERAFELGAYDYLEKGELLWPLLRHKLLAAVAEVRLRGWRALDAAETEDRIRDLHSQLRQEVDGNKKGRLLEEVVQLLMSTVPGFEHIEARASNLSEEIDLFIRNQSTDPFWQRQGDYILVECKNWSSHVSAKEFRDFKGKIEARYGRARLGLLVAPGGFAASFAVEQAKLAMGDIVIVCIDGEDLATLVASDNRGEQLKGWIGRAVLNK